MFRQRRRLEEEEKNNTENKDNCNVKGVSALSGNVHTRLSKRYSFYSTSPRAERPDWPWASVNEPEPFHGRGPGGYLYQRRGSGRFGMPPNNAYQVANTNNGGPRLNPSAYHVADDGIYPQTQRINSVSDSNTSFNKQHSSSGFRDNRLAPVPETPKIDNDVSVNVNRDAVQFYNGTAAYYNSHSISEPVYL